LQCQNRKYKHFFILLLFLFLFNSLIKNCFEILWFSINIIHNHIKYRIKFLTKMPERIPPAIVQITICKQHMVYLHKSDLFRSLHFRRSRRWSKSSCFDDDGRPRDCKLIIKCRTRSANYKDDKTRVIKQAVAESKNAFEFAFDANQFKHRATLKRTTRGIVVIILICMSFRAFVRDFTTATLRDQVNKRREFIVSEYLYMDWMCDRWHGTCNEIDFFLLSSTEREREESLEWHLNLISTKN